MEADRMQGSIFEPKVLESERGVVASERRMSGENNNDAILGENVRAPAIMAHPYHWDVIGWMSDIQSWKRDEILAYYDQEGFKAGRISLKALERDEVGDALLEEGLLDVDDGPGDLVERVAALLDRVD